MLQLGALQGQLLLLGVEALLQPPQPLGQRLALQCRGMQLCLGVAVARRGVPAAGLRAPPALVVAGEDGLASGGSAGVGGAVRVAAGRVDCALLARMDEGELGDLSRLCSGRVYGVLFARNASEFYIAVGSCATSNLFQKIMNLTPQNLQSAS